MPSTYTGTNAVAIVSAYIKGIPTSAVDISVVDMVNSVMWTAYPWKWSLSALTAIALVDGQQDYTIANSDFYRLVHARIVRTDTTPDEYYDIPIMSWLPPDLTKVGYTGISSICYEETSSKLRIVRAAEVPSGVTLQIQGEYQKHPTKLTSLASTFPFPDQYFQIFLDGLLGRLYQFADDPRAKEHMALFYAGLERMKAAEDWNRGDTVYPDEPLGAGAVGNPSFFV